MSERVFEFRDGTSNKFWAVSVEGDTQTVRYGKIGTAGQTKTKAFADSAAAAKDTAKLVAEKTGKGYVEQASGGRQPPVSAPPAPSQKRGADAPRSPGGSAADGPDGRRVDLPRADWLFASWRPLDTLPPAGPKPKPPKEVASKAAALLDADKLVDVLSGKVKLQERMLPYNNNIPDLVQRHAVAYLTEAQRDECRAAVREVLPTLTFGGWLKLPNLPFYVAALLGMHAEMAAVVAKWPVPLRGVSTAVDAEAWRIVLGLGSADEVVAAVRRFELGFGEHSYYSDRNAEIVRGWIAHTLWHELGFVTEGVLKANSREVADKLTRQLGRVYAPETAVEMLRIAVEGKYPVVAREWLLANPEHTITGLTPHAHGSSNFAKAAVDLLRQLRRAGHGEAITHAVGGLDAARVEGLTATIFEDEAGKYAELPADEMPEELREALADVGKPLALDLAALPPIVVGGKKLGEKAVTALLNAIRTIKEASLPAAVVAVRRHAEPHSLDKFAWELFETWQKAGMAPKEKWMFAAIGFLGGDASAIKLTPLIREWPGQSKHQTAVMGLKVLCGIGTDTALMALNGIAQKVKFAGIKKNAQATMEEIASARGLSRAELEDRIVPDLGLDDRGGRDLDFGPRQFRVLLDAALNPVVRDPDGKTRGELPKPNAKDDPAKADAAVAEWKLLKKQLKEVARSQGPRLEQAMVTMRRWTPADFDTLIVKHPLMTNFARRLVWGGFDKAGKLTTSFRVTEELELADASDRPVTLDGVAAVGILHPMHLDDAQRAAWGQLLGDYEIVPPFTQLGRPVVTLTDAEKKETECRRFAGAKIDPAIVYYGLPKMGWFHSSPMDGGHFDYFWKQFPGAAVTAEVQLDPGMGISYLEGAEKQALAAVRFVVGTGERSWAYYGDKRPGVLKLGDVDPIVVSEVLSELGRVAAKAQ